MTELKTFYCSLNKWPPKQGVIPHEMILWGEGNMLELVIIFLFVKKQKGAKLSFMKCGQ